MTNQDAGPFCHGTVSVSWWALILLICLVAGCGQSRPPRTAQNPQVRVSGRETWSLTTGDTVVLETALLKFHDGEAMLVVKASCETPGPMEKPLAKELAEYAVQHKYLKKAEARRSLLRAKKLGNRIGVALVAPDGKSGYRFNFSLDELGHQEEAGKTPPSEDDAEITKQRRPNNE